MLAAGPLVLTAATSAPDSVSAAAVSAVGPVAGPGPLPVRARGDAANLQGAWQEPELGDRTRRVIQGALKHLGHYDAAIDGVFGRTTRAAIWRYQVGNGFTGTGYLTSDQILKLFLEARGEGERLAAAAIAAQTTKRETPDGGATVQSTLTRQESVVAPSAQQAPPARQTTTDQPAPVIQVPIETPPDAHGDLTSSIQTADALERNAGAASETDAIFETSGLGNGGRATRAADPPAVFAEPGGMTPERSVSEASMAESAVADLTDGPAQAGESDASDAVASVRPRSPLEARAVEPVPADAAPATPPDQPRGAVVPVQPPERIVVPADSPAARSARLTEPTQPADRTSEPMATALTVPRLPVTALNRGAAMPAPVDNLSHPTAPPTGGIVAPTQAVRRSGATVRAGTQAVNPQSRLPVSVEATRQASLSVATRRAGSDMPEELDNQDRRSATVIASTRFDDLTFIAPLAAPEPAVRDTEALVPTIASDPPAVVDTPIGEAVPAAADTVLESRQVAVADLAPIALGTDGATSDASPDLAGAFDHDFPADRPAEVGSQPIGTAAAPITERVASMSDSDAPSFATGRDGDTATGMPESMIREVTGSGISQDSGIALNADPTAASAVSVPARTAGPEIGMGTQWDRAFPQVDNREKRAGDARPGAAAMGVSDLPPGVSVIDIPGGASVGANRQLALSPASGGDAPGSLGSDRSVVSDGNATDSAGSQTRGGLFAGLFGRQDSDAPAAMPRSQQQTFQNNRMTANWPAGIDLEATPSRDNWLARLDGIFTGYIQTPDAPGEFPVKTRFDYEDGVLTGEFQSFINGRRQRGRLTEVKVLDRRTVEMTWRHLWEAGPVRFHFSEDLTSFNGQWGRDSIENVAWIGARR